MTRRPQLYYDKTCPVCSNYVRMLKKKVSEEKMDYLAASQDAKDFKYVNSEGLAFTGLVAIDKLTADFPEIKDFMFMLPPSLRASGLKTAYKVASVARRTINKITRKGCNCGK